MKWLKKLNELVEQNPDAEIIHVVSEEANSGEFCRMPCHEIGVELTKYIMWGDEMIEDAEELEEELQHTLYPESTAWSSERLNLETAKAYEAHIAKNPWTKAIFINVG